MQQSFRSFFRTLFDLRHGAEEKDVIIENIKSDVTISSARFWILIFAVGVASVGLNINSTPVIIGAMLISPLMGPIVGIGLALAINDWPLMRKSVRNLLVLTGIAVFVSTVYFALTPISNAQSELLARTQPTIFDVLIAIFGGLAGFIGLSREKHTNVIPGVAIATALMPPLCTVGYGIGTGQPTFVFGAAYLFLINSIFICLSSLLISRYLRLPRVQYTDLEHQKKVRRIITTVIVLITTPAVYLAYTFVERNNFEINAAAYVQKTFTDQGHVVVYQDITYGAAGGTIKLAFLNERFTDAELTIFTDRLDAFGLEHTTLVVRQDGFALTEEEWQNVLSEMQNDNERVLALEAKLAREQASFYSPEKLLAEAQAIDGRIIDLATAPLSYAEDTTPLTNELLVIIHTPETAPPLTTKEAATITDWLTARIEHATITTYFEPALLPSTTTTHTKI
ncbi:MAG: TIGR00341 family protein [Candidatus Pacebacteria bacterium]|nr:TIGR00341 family protein [Candidatus Paceibacterota bacterium]